MGVDGIEPAIDDGTEAGVTQDQELIEAFWEAVLLLEVFANFSGEVESDECVGSSVPMLGAIDDEFAGLKYEVFNSIV